MKPLIRWTIGSVSELGFETLKYSIELFKKNYRNEFKYVICYNNLDSRRIRCLRKMNCELVNQNLYKSEYSIGQPLKSSGPAWKLYPARLSKKTYEIFIDNDLILYDRLSQLEDFLNSKKIIFTEALRRSYGKFDKFIKEKYYINTGIIGLPPHFDFKKEIEMKIKEMNLNCWSDYFDEQAVVANIIQNNDNIMIPITEISVCDTNMDFQKGKKGIHFIGINSGKSVHWNNYWKGRII